MVETKTPMVSVIMPVYNANQYLQGAIDSVLAQTYTDFELILVDDGSTDGSGNLCDHYGETDNRVKVIHQKNGGICNARNRGLREAEGKYIAFCDHDDLYVKVCLEKAVAAAEQNHAALTKYTYISERWKQGALMDRHERRNPDCTLGLEAVAENYEWFNHAIRAVWNGLYLREFLISVSAAFDETVKSGFEDFLFNLFLMPHLESITFISEPLYRHFVRFEQSTDEKYNKNKIDAIIVSLKAEASFFQKTDVDMDKFTVRQQYEYLLPVMRQLYHPDNPEDERYKHQKLDEFRGVVPVGPSVRAWAQGIKEKPKESLFLLIFRLRWYNLLALIYIAQRRVSYGIAKRHVV